MKFFRGLILAFPVSILLWIAIYKGAMWLLTY
jgi:hypothetical protein